MIKYYITHDHLFKICVNPINPHEEKTTHENNIFTEADCQKTKKKRFFCMSEHDVAEQLLTTFCKEIIPENKENRS